MKTLSFTPSNNMLTSYFKGWKGSWFRVLYTGLIFAVLIALTVVGVNTWNEVHRQAATETAPKTQSLAETVSRFIMSQDQLFSSIIKSFDLQNGGETKSVLKGILNTSKQMRTVALIDLQHQVIAIEGESTLDNWAAVFPHTSSQSIQLGKPYRKVLFGEHYLPIRKAVVDDRQKVIGYIVAIYQLAGESGVWSNNAIKTDISHIIFSDSDGRVFSEIPERKSLLNSFGTPRVPNELFARFGSLVDNLVSGEVESPEGTIIFSAKKISAYNAYVSVFTYKKSLLSLWLQKIQLSVLIIFASAIFGVLILRINMRRANVSEEEKFEAQHNVSKLSKAIEQSPSSVIVTNGAWITEYANRKLLDGTGKLIEIQPNVKLIDAYPHNLLLPDIEKITNLLRVGENWYCERCSEKQQQWFSFSISQMSANAGDEESFIIITQNITERKKAEANLYKQAYFDSLTGLPNRRNSSVLLQKSLSEAAKNQHKVALVYLDLDNFKQVNDRYGHGIGDQLLQTVAHRLGMVMHSVGTACHMSGDEFLVFLNYEKREQIIKVIDLLVNNITSPIDLEGKQLFVTVSMGVSCYPNDCMDEKTMLKHADIALYSSKESGRNCYSFFDEELEAKSKRKIELESEVRHALDKDELFMVYQTKNVISDGTVCSFEALMRWDSKTLGFVGPDEFIVAAETIGVIDKMGEFALYQACRDLKLFQQVYQKPLTMAVNLSMRQLNNDDIVTVVRNVLEKEKIDPSQLELEITESLLAERFDVVLPILNKLLALGVSLSIDDFGTGYSSLNYLTRFPVKTLKIDRCFVVSMVDGGNDATLVETVITMAHRLGLKVVAEGIESEVEIAMLNNFDCDIGQGYHYSKPLKNDVMLEHLEKLQEQHFPFNEVEQEFSEKVEMSLGLELSVEPEATLQAAKGRFDIEKPLEDRAESDKAMPSLSLESEDLVGSEGGLLSLDDNDAFPNQLTDDSSTVEKQKLEDADKPVSSLSLESDEPIALEGEFVDEPVKSVAAPREEGSLSLDDDTFTDQTTGGLPLLDEDEPQLGNADKPVSSLSLESDDPVELEGELEVKLKSELKSDLEDKQQAKPEKAPLEVGLLSLDDDDALVVDVPLATDIATDMATADIDKTAAASLDFELHHSLSAEEDFPAFDNSDAALDFNASNNLDYSNVEKVEPLKAGPLKVGSVIDPNEADDDDADGSLTTEDINHLDQLAKELQLGQQLEKKNSGPDSGHLKLELD